MVEVKQIWQNHKHLWKRISVPAKAILLKEGEVSKKAFFIAKGCIRVWFNSEGKEISFQFFFEGETVVSIESFREQIPSLYNIETIEPCILYTIHKDDLNKAVQNDENLKDYIVNLAFNRQSQFIRHFLNFLKDNPQERYRRLMVQRPKVLQRIPLQYVASYLGITAVSLSRIRSKF